MSDFPPPPPAAGQPWNQAGPYAYTAGPMPPMRSLKGLALAATILFVVIALVDAAAAAVRMNRASLLDDLIDFSSSVEEQDLLDADNAVAAVSVLHLLVAIGLIVVFIVWQFRHAKNAETLGVRGGLGPGWAIGGWFIPLANFVLPGMQLFQSSKGSDVAARREGRSPKGAGVVIGWAIALALGAIISGSSGALVSTDDQGNAIIESFEDIEDAASSDRTAAVGYAFFILAAVLGIAMVRGLTERQTAAYEETAATGAAAPPAPPPGGSWGTPSAQAPGTWAPPPPAATPAPPAPPPPPPGDFPQPE